MSNPILTPTEYDALCNILEWAWTSVHQEPELCLKDINYYHPDKPDDYDPVMGGECGLGMMDEFEYTLDNPDQLNIMTMIETLMYKLNCSPCLANGLGNTWETLSPIIDNEERDRLSNLDSTGRSTMQTLEGYVVEDIGAKNKVAQLQEYFESVGEDGTIQVGENTWIDGMNSDLFL